MNNLSKAVDILREGGVVAYPTDTAYGLAVDATNLKAVYRLYEVKGRDYSKPVSVIFPDTESAEKIVKFNAQAKKVAKKYWPGGVTLVLPLKAKGNHWTMLSAKTGTLGVRYPEHDVAQELVRLLEKPITATSANLSGMPTCYSVAQIKKQFAKAKAKPDYYLDGGVLRKNAISTMLHIDGKHVTLLREGVVDFHDILRHLA